MIILGIDASYTCTGLVWLKRDEKCVSVVTHDKLKFPPHPQRLFKAMCALHASIKALKPELAIVEDVPPYMKGLGSTRTTGMLFKLQGVACATLEGLGVDYLLISPTMVKKDMCGRGDCEKWMVAREIKERYGIEFPDDPGHDLSDACALALWGLEQRGRKIA